MGSLGKWITPDGQWYRQAGWLYPVTQCDRIVDHLASLQTSVQVVTQKKLILFRLFYMMRDRVTLGDFEPGLMMGGLGLSWSDVEETILAFREELTEILLLMHEAPRENGCAPGWHVPGV